MTRMLTKKMRGSFQCSQSLTNFVGNYIFRKSSLYDTEKQRLLTLKRIIN